MHARSSVAFIVISFNFISYDCAAAGQSCSKMTTLVSCNPDIRKLMEQPVTLSLMVRALGGGEQEISRRCQ
jgi:hypothetical protein